MAVLLWWGGQAQVLAADSRLQAQLVWGTDQSKVQDQTEVEAKLRDKLRNVFKWKNYFEVSKTPVAVPANGAQKVKLSEDCTLDVKHLGAKNFEVKLIGKGRHVTTKRMTFTKDESLVMAGDDKNDTAWFVVLTLAEK